MENATLSAKRKRAAESTGLLQDMLAFVSEETVEGSPLYPAANHATGKSSSPVPLPCLDDEALQLMYEDVPFLKLIDHQENKQNLSPVNPTFNYDPIQNNEAAIPPPPAKRTAPTVRPPRRKGTPSYREAHIHSERQRRQDMTGLFSTLRALLPKMEDDDQFKGDRCTVLGYVIEYVQQLDKKVQELGRLRAQLFDQQRIRNLVFKQEEGPIRKRQGSSSQQATQQIVQSSGVSVRFWGHVDLFITLNCPKQRGIWPHLMVLLQDTLQLDIQNVTLSATPYFFVHSIYAKIPDEEDREVSREKLRAVLAQFVAHHNLASRPA